MKTPIHLKAKHRPTANCFGNYFPVSVRYKHLEIGLSFAHKLEADEFISLISKEHVDAIQAIKSLQFAKTKCKGRHDYANFEFFSSLIENC